jgi:hypothetical protein
MMSFAKTFVAGQNEPFGLLSPQDAIFKNMGASAGVKVTEEVVTDDESSSNKGLDVQCEECPICMDAIDPDRNCVTTECGHRFHAKCLFANIAHNGFGCPCCRGKMAEEEDEEEEGDDYGEFDEEDFDEEEEEEDNTDHLLRGMRWLFQRASNDGGVVDEDEEEEEDDEEEEEEEEVEPPSIDLITEKLTERGITFEQVIKALLNDCHPEYSAKFVTEADQLFGGVRSILANYARQNGQEEEE